MFGIFKSLFGGKPASGSETLELEARLAPVAGGQGRGEVEYEAHGDGARELEVELSAMAEGECEVFIAAKSIGKLTPIRGRCEWKRSTRRGDSVPECREGEHVEIRQSGAPVLQGSFVRDL